MHSEMSVDNKHKQKDMISAGVKRPQHPKEILKNSRIAQISIGIVLISI